MTDEDVFQFPGPEAGGWIRRLAPLLWRHRRKVALALGASITGMVITSVLPLLQKVIVDDGIIARSRPLTPLVVLLLGIGVLRFAGSGLRRFTGGRVSLDIQYDIRNAMYEHLQRLDFARHDEMQTGQLVSRANSDVNLVQSLLAWLPLMLGNLLQFAFSLVAMLFLSPVLTLVSMLVLPLTFVLALRMRKVVYPSSWDAQQREGEMTSVVDEATVGVRVVKGFGQERRELDRLVDAVTRMFGADMRNVRFRARFTAALQSLPTFGQLGVLVLGGWLALHGHITVGTFLAFTTYLAQLSAPARTLAGMLTIAQQARAGADRIFELLDSLSDVQEKPDAEQLPAVDGRITFDGVSFGYLKSDPVLSPPLSADRSG